MTTTKTTTCNPSAEFLYQMAQEFGYGAHAIYSPSGSKMWAYCSGSLIPNLFADNENSYESSEGTVAHWVSERWLKTGKRPDHLIGLIIPMFSETHLFQIEVTHDMLDSVEIYVSACFEEQKNAEIMLVEEHVSLGDLPPKLWHDGEWHEFPPQGGTIDNLIVKSGKLIITDLKYGVGVPVSADHNFQLMLYAYGAYLRYGIKYKIDRVVLRIAQVRLGPVQSFEMTIKDLLMKVKWFKYRMELAWDVSAKRTPGPEQCRWCRVKHECPALLSLIIDIVSGAFCDEPDEMDDNDMATVKETLADEYRLIKGSSSKLSEDEKVTVLQMRTVVNEFFESVKRSLEHSALSGKVPKGMKLVNGRSNRVFKNNKAAYETMLLYGLDDEDLLETKTISPAQAEELMRNKLGLKREIVTSIIKTLAIQPSGKPTLALASDRRPELENFDDSEIWD